MALDEIKTELVSGEASAPVSLLIHSRDAVKAAPLAEGVPTVIGRELPSNIVVRESTLSRQHAEFCLLSPEQVSVCDLKSTNGVKINGRIVERGVFGPGDVVTLGAVSVSLYAIATDGQQQQLLTGHDRFLPELASELSRCAAFDQQLGLLMLRCARPAAGQLGRWFLEARKQLRPFDRVALYSPDEVEIAVPATDREQVLQLARSLANYSTPPLFCGLAIYPEDARSPEEMIAVARAALKRASISSPLIVAGGLLGAAAEQRKEVPIARSPAMCEVFQTVERVADSMLPVLIYGETGTGKEVVANAIHARSNRSAMALCCLNCGALPSELIESALFGHERGAFTGAAARKKGLFEEADGGTLLLDEVGELSAAAQVALLRVLENKKITRVGAHDEINVDVRVLAATNRDLDAMCASGAFREDLLYRLNAITIRLPALRERVEEIEALALRFIEEANRDNDCSVWGLDPEVNTALRRYSWPGNVRELRNAVERAVVMARSGVLTIDELPERVRYEKRARVSTAVQPVITPERLEIESRTKLRTVEVAADPTDRVDNEDGPVSISLKNQVQHHEKLLLLSALRRCGWNRTEAARQLGIPLRTLFYKVKSYGLKANHPSIKQLLDEVETTASLQGEIEFKQSVQQLEVQLIRDALRQTNNNRSAAAQLLQTTPRTLASKMKSYGLDSESATGKAIDGEVD